MIQLLHADDQSTVGRPPGPLRFGLVLVFLLLPAPGAAQVPPELTWQAEVRPRFFAREPVEGQWDHWVSARTRVGLDVRFQAGLGLFIQLQDVRFWGEETTHRDRSADAVDFHQAYLEVDSVPGIGGLIRAGRQEVSLAEGRFIAAPDWGQAGQSFDGVRWMWPLGGGRVDLIYLRLREGSAPAHEYSADMMGAWVALPVAGLGSLEFLALHDRSGEPDGNRQSTMGSIWRKDVGGLSFRAQGMVQVGERNGVDLSAWMLALRGTLSTFDGKGSVTLWYDRLSGDPDPTDHRTESFSNLFGARHRYYGRGDYFLTLPDDTGGLGLQDSAVKVAYSPTPVLSCNLDLHHFSTTEAGALSSRHLGAEADLWVRYRFREALALEVGYSVIRAGTAMEELGRLEGTGNAVYFMSSVAF